MKKQIIISSIISATILGITSIAILSKNANAELNNNNAPLLATTNTLTTSKTVISSKNETVYVITDENGNAKSKFIGSTIYDGTEELPFDFKVTYYLNGQEISSKDLAGKSGHVKIIYAYNSTAFYQSKRIPFLAITGITLDHSKFTNVKVDNGKIISGNSDSYIIAGYGIAGMNQDLGTDFLPDTFTLEADTTNFNLENTYTIFTNDILADLDTSKLNSLDNLTNSVYQLEDGINKLINGATDLSKGLSSALDGAKQLYAGSQTLAAGLKELDSYSSELIAGTEQLASMVPDIANLMRDKKASLEEQLVTLQGQKAQLEAMLAIPGLDEETRAQIQANLTQIEAGIPQIQAGITKLTSGLSKLSKIAEFYNGLVEYTEGVSSASAGATQISAGLGTLVEGETKLYQGSITLKDGLNTFKTSGIDKLVNFASKDLANFTYNVRTTVNAAASYRNFGNVDAQSVKFIVKTPNI